MKNLKILRILTILLSISLAAMVIMLVLRDINEDFTVAIVFAVLLFRQMKPVPVP